MTVFALGWATTGMGLARADVLPVQLIGVLFFAALIPVTALAADKFGQVRVLIASTIGIGLFGALFAPLLHGGLSGLLIFFALGFALMGCTYGPLGAAMARPFPTAVRYTGASMAFNLAGILGASLAPYVALKLAQAWGPAAVGGYLSAAALLTGSPVVQLVRYSQSSFPATLPGGVVDSFPLMAPPAIALSPEIETAAAAAKAARAAQGQDDEQLDPLTAH